jgi:hypothetical protein
MIWIAYLVVLDEGSQSYKPPPDRNIALQKSKATDVS